ncbi:bacteriohemerythrin [Anaeromyxobacter dehalogenans]|uniref:Hemerythrin-like, metal-binding protein n=1 Tax=Anaeromyxobacter dehalogenans (strain 2CP-C) TaxID=290397 RepID=Q2INH0_ANADE|nr:bacteriohemerythrin [Anaeromyxobacter dehalogenans]ABC80351.1 Hemerythrin-like, metal-binding protein [Anaeromyxobacter dehalogenans 2CP-C]
MALHWTSVLSIGVPELDAEHEEMFTRMDRLHDAILSGERAEVSRMIEYLREHAVRHLAAEETLMLAIGYPDRERHLREHEAFLATVRELTRRHDANGPTAVLVHDVERAVASWIDGHVGIHDVALGAFAREHLRRRQGGERRPA